MNDRILLPLFGKDRSGRSRREIAEEITGMSLVTLHRMNGSDWPGILRARGEGNGIRYYLHVPTFASYSQRMRAAS